MYLDTVKHIHAYHWDDDFIIPDSVNERVEELASSENIQLLHNVSPVFKWAPGVPIDDKYVTDE